MTAEVRPKRGEARPATRSAPAATTTESPQVDPAATSLLILAAVIAFFVWNRLSVGVVAILTALSLYATGVLSAESALAGFGDPVVVFLASLFVVSEGIDAAGVTTWAGQALIDRAGERRVPLLLAVMLLCALLTALITLNGSVAALLPMVMVLATRVGEPPSRMLMPLAFAGSAGSLLTLTGSPVNVIVSDFSREAGAPGFGFFEFAVIGLPLLVGTMALAVVLGPRVLPARVSKDVPPDLGRHAQTLAGHYALENGFYRLRVRERSPLIGRSRGAIDLSGYQGVTLIGVQSAAEPPLREDLEVGDVVVVTGTPEQVSRLVVDQTLAVGMKPLTSSGDETLLGRELGVVEVVVPPRSPLVGETVFPGMARGSDLVILGWGPLPHHSTTLETASGDNTLRDSCLDSSA